jgi:hypothetical protein
MKHLFQAMVFLKNRVILVQRPLAGFLNETVPEVSHHGIGAHRLLITEGFDIVTLRSRVVTHYHHMMPFEKASFSLNWTPEVLKLDRFL